MGQAPGAVLEASASPASTRSPRWRRLVDILHADDRDAHSPGRLRLLLEEMPKPAALDVAGHAPRRPDVELPAEVEDAAYRVVQEGLTNVMKHAPGAEVEVRLGLRGDAFEIVVRNDGRQRTLAARRNRLGPRGSPACGSASSPRGGSLDAGPDGGGWRLHARLARGRSSARPRAG